MPRVIAACTLIAAAVLSTRIYAGVSDTGWSHSRTLVVMLGAAFALAIVRSGGMVRAEFTVASEALQIRVGKHERELPYEQLESIGYETPFVKPRQWLPALILNDRFGKRWRVPSLIEDGDRFLGDLLAATGREDLVHFASVYEMPAKMAAVRRRLLLGYGVGLALILAAFLFTLTGPTR